MELKVTNGFLFWRGFFVCIFFFLAFLMEMGEMHNISFSIDLEM